MTSPMKYYHASFWMLIIMFPISSYASSSSSSLVSPRTTSFLRDLHLQCPANVMYTWPIEINGESLDKLLSSNQMNTYVAILFYASWCPFSRNFQPKFDALSSMFPQIKHVMVELSSVQPIIFSKHGIHSVPTVLLVNQTTRMRFHGPKDLHAFVHFYQKATGLEPAMDLTKDPIIFPENKSTISESHNKYQLKNMISREPYLVFSIFFLLLKTLLYLYPNMISNIIALWLASIPHLNLSIFGESRQLLARVLQLVDFKRVFNKLKLVRSARAWTSSLASFSFCKAFSFRAPRG
ncbi:5'-adenylylsulfate reductase-like 7 [Bidens hawaiensis]|uniref:5'-adenylylsulfate reductase-like 7 n=1 Tax=Bidens hawaiensis TaxID=980011 RepID=UPI0040490E19